MPNTTHQYQFNTDREQAKAASSSASAIGKGIAGDSSEIRNSVVEGVQKTLSTRMKNANKTSSKNAKALRSLVKSKVDDYNNKLSDIQTLEENSQSLQSEIDQKTAEKEALEASEGYKAHKTEWSSSQTDYLSKRKAAANEEYMKKKQQDLSSREAYMDAYTNLLAASKQQMDTSPKRSKKDQQAAEALYAANLHEWTEGQRKLTEERTAVRAYRQADSRHLTDEYYTELISERDAAKIRYDQADAAFKTERARVQRLASEIHDAAGELTALQKEQGEKKADILKNSEQDHADLTSRILKHHESSAGYSSLYDKAAMQYYIVKREKNAEETKKATIQGSSKNISEYVGHPELSPFSLAHKFAEIKRNPKSTQKHKIEISDFADTGNPATHHIIHHKFITLTQDNKVYRLDSKYEIQTDDPAGSAGTTPAHLADLTGHSINQTDRHGQYKTTSNTLAIQTVVTGSAFHGQDVNGLWIDGEFVPSNGAAYQSVSDARRKYQKKMEEHGDFDQDDELALAIRDSDFFNHIYAENIEYYAKYPGDQELRKTTQLDEADPADPAISLAALKLDYKDADEDHKALHLFQQRKTSHLAALAADDSELYTDGAQRDRVIAKLVHAMLVLNKDRKEAIQIADQYGSNALKKTVAESSEGNFASLLYACEIVMIGDSETESTAARFFGASGEFLDGDGPLKGTAAEGLINYGQIMDTYETLNNTYGFASGKIQHIDKLDAKMKKAKKEFGAESDNYKSLKDQKEDAERDLEHGLGGDILGIISSIKDVFFGFKTFVDMCREKRFLSDEHAAEKDLQSRYVSVFDYIFDVGNAILNLADSILGLLGNDIFSNKYFDLSCVSPFGDLVSFVKDVFGTIESAYKVVQSSRKVHNITKTMDTVATGRLTEGTGANAVTVDISDAVKANPQVMYLLGRARNKAGKDVADSTIDTATGAVNTGGHFATPLGSRIIKVTTSAVSTLGKLITNGVYQGKEKTAALKAAFKDKYIQYQKNPNFDRILKMTAGIRSLKHLTVVSRIFAAIDTHHMLRSAPAASTAFKYARTAMGAFYGPKQNPRPPLDADKQGYDAIPLSAILGHVNEGDDWRDKLLAAVR